MGSYIFFALRTDLKDPSRKRRQVDGSSPVDLAPDPLVTTYVWPRHPQSDSFYHGQLLMYQDCLERHVGEFEWFLFIDADDFLVVPALLLSSIRPDTKARDP